MKTLFWFRNDLRLQNNQALSAALKSEKCYLVYIYDTSQNKPLAAAQNAWLHHSLKKLQLDIEKLDGKLNVKRGCPDQVILDIVQEKNIDAVFWNQRFLISEVERDNVLIKKLKQLTVRVNVVNANIFSLKPDQILNKQGQPYKVFTYYYKFARQHLQQTGYSSPETLVNTLLLDDQSSQINALKVIPDKGNFWVDKVLSNWSIGETAAFKQLDQFLLEKLDDYSKKRDNIDQQATSVLSVHLAFGEIDVVTIINELLNQPQTSAVEAYIRQLIWREFSYYLMWHFPKISTKNFNSKFDSFSWENNPEMLKKWQQGKTGYPIVDAGMQELWQTGYMHNRVRMIVASFLTKHLLIDWRCGENWFWDTLIDADPAVNPVSWQWVAGSGADAAPYFRIFNPWLQARKFDPEANYIKKWLPQLRSYSATDIHNPKKRKNNYFTPIVDHDFARKRALEKYKAIK